MKQLKKEDLITYEYSYKERVSKQKLVYQYFYGDYNPQVNNDGYVILFYGKTGDHKITTINVFFNIIKGINLQDNFRFILIIENLSLMFFIHII